MDRNDAYLSGDGASVPACGSASGNSSTDRLYVALAFFDTRDGSFESELVRAAREGYERSAPEMNELGAWDEFDRLLERHREAMVAERFEHPRDTQ